MSLGTLILKSCGSRLVFGENYNAGGFLIKTANRTYGNIFFFGMKIIGCLIRKTVMVVTAAGMGNNAGWFIDSKKILVFGKESEGEEDRSGGMIR